MPRMSFYTQLLPAVTVLLLVSSRGLAEQQAEQSSPSATEWPWTKLTAPEFPAVRNAEWVQNPIDAFVLAKLEAHGLKPAPSASSRARLRRIYFGLIGLPPSYEEMDAFLKNPTLEAYQGTIERLLKNPGYGEHWGRRWLDLVRYADTQGGALDYARPHMWRYRDYVVRAFNQDRPYDRFIREQLAGDSYRAYGAEGRLGLAFLHQWVPVERDEPELNRRDFLNDVVGVTGSAFLGLTLSCARCHDHKYDPLPIRDYYRIEAFFAPLQVSSTSVAFGQYENPLLDPEKWKEKKQAWKELLDQRRKWRETKTAEFKDRIQQRRFLAATADLKDLAVPVSERELSEAMKEGVLFNEQERKVFRLIRRQSARFANPNHPEYFEPKAYTAGDSPLKHFVATHVLAVGDFRSKQEAVEPGYLSAITGHSDPVNLDGITGSRRKLLAEWLASPDNPLTARVMVNRIWQHHFGKGLVATSSDFGENGSGTVHSDLIDWLAVQFIESGWSIKEIHRLILSSNVYQQSVNHPQAAEFEMIDAENHYLWVREQLRLEAEAIRDSVLAVSGQLNHEVGGPPFFPVVDDELMQRAPTWWEPSSTRERDRRTIYMLQIRSLQSPFIKVFDGPNMDESCPVREVTTVTPQAFALFNSNLSHQQSQAFAQRIEMKVGTAPVAQVERAFQIAFQRPPTEIEREKCVAFLTATPSTEPASSGSDIAPIASSGEDNVETGKPRGSLADLCLVLFNSNEFVYLE